MSGAQQLAADPRLSAFVRANAGSGKTKTLIDRTARLLLAGADPAAILCVTYTRAAAAEMQRRLFAVLGEWSVLEDGVLRERLAGLEGRPADSFSSEDLSRARRLFARALETPGGLKIQTIHAFCERLLRRFPLEAEVLPGFTVIDDAEAAVIAARAQGRLAGIVRGGDHPAITEAYARMSVALDFQAFQAMFASFEAERAGLREWLDGIGGLAGLPQALKDLLGLDRLEEPEAVELAAVSPPQLDPQAWFAAARGLAVGTDKTDQPTGRLIQSVAEAALRGEPMLEAVRGIFLTGAGEPRKTLATKAVSDEIRDWLAREQLRFCQAMERARANRVAQETGWVMTLAFVYLQAFEEAKRERGVLDFADLVDRTCELLRSKPAAAWVLYKLDGGIDHILLDEAQDTAPEQWRIIRGLTGEFFSGAGRPADRPLDRSLFIVGDNKQSIYSFQGAAPERLVEEIRQYDVEIRGVGGRAEDVRLEETFRSTAEVLTFVDRVFEPPEMLQAVEPDGRLVKHIQGRRDGGTGCIDLWPPFQDTPGEERLAWDAPLDLESDASATVRLARQIAAEIRALVRRGDAVYDKDQKVRRPAGYGDVLVLVRRRGALFEEVLRALKKQDIPVAGADRLALSAHIAFDDLLALARFALFPGDDLTLAALLKSPFCGLTDEDIYQLGRGRPADLWTVLGRRASENPCWSAAAGFVEQVVRDGAQRRPFDFFARILSRLDGDGRSGREKMLARLGAEAADAIDEFLSQVLALEQLGKHDLESLTHALGAIDIQVKREMDEGAGKVRIMTAHGAKGLEAPIVILPEMTWAPQPRARPLLRTADGAYLWCGSAKQDCAATAAVRDAIRRKDEEEQLRLLYVALTRARERLILCGRIGATARKVGRWYEAASQALEGLGGLRTAEGEAGLVFRRFGPDPEPLPATVPPAAPPALAPDWLGQVAAQEARTARFLSPSALDDAARAPAVSPLAGTAGLGRFRRGSLIHRLLQLLPDIDPARRADAARLILSREPDLTDDQRVEMIAAAFGVLDDDRFAAVFGLGSRAEVAIAGAAAGLPEGVAISGQVDRLVVSGTRVLVVDFKTNRPAPARIEDADPAYIRQMAAYAAALHAAFPDKVVEAALIWTDGPLLMPVPENLMAEALAELRRAS